MGAVPAGVLGGVGVASCGGEELWVYGVWSSSVFTGDGRGRPSYDLWGISNASAGLRLAWGVEIAGIAAEGAEIESQRNDEENTNALLQYQTKTNNVVTAVRRIEEAERTTNAARHVVPRATPQNAGGS